MADAPLVIANHRDDAFRPMQIFTHDGALFREGHIYQLPADLTVDPPPDPTNTTIALTDLLVGAETLGTSNDFLNVARCIQRAATRTGPALGIATEYITVDFEGVNYFAEDPMGFSNLGPVIGTPNRKTIIHGNVSNPAVKGGLKQITYDGTDPASTRYRVLVVSTGGPEGDHRVSSGGDGIPSIKYRNRLLFQFTNCRHITFDSFKFVGSNSSGPSLSNFWYDVQREGQHCFWLIGGHHFRFVDCDVSQTFGDVIFTNPYRNLNANPPETKSTEHYTGEMEALGGTWKKIGRIYITMNQVRASDAIVDPDFWKNPGDGTGPFEAGRNNLPYTSSAPSLSGTGYGVWWHGNAAHKFLGQGCKRSRVDVENLNSFAHCQDIRIGADTESYAIVDQQNFRFTGQGGNLITAVNSWGLIDRMTISRIHDSGDGGMTIRIFGSPFAGTIGGPDQTTVAASMEGDPSSPFPSTIAVAATAGWPPAGYFQVDIGPVFTPTTIVVKYTGISGNNFTGCTLWQGTAGPTFRQDRAVKQRYVKAERPKYVCQDFTLIDCVFDGTNTSLFQLDRVERATVQRNRSNYRKANAANEIRFQDCPGLNLGPGSAPWYSNDFRPV
jgi:hypothetical protein